jgi:RHS repeat-associated protein
VEGIANPFKYIGELGVTHESNGLYYMRSRFYDPNLGRFVSPDPLGEAADNTNLYVYANNKPTQDVDPKGESAISPIWIVGPILVYFTIKTAIHLSHWYMNHNPKSKFPFGTQPEDT